MCDKIVFHNNLSGETLVHWEKPDGTSHLKFGATGT